MFDYLISTYQQLTFTSNGNDSNVLRRERVITHSDFSPS